MTSNPFKAEKPINTMPIQIHPVKAFTDNYIWVIHNQQSAMVVDPGESHEVNTFLTDNNLQLDTILLTHHHYDHINGVEQLMAQWNCDVFGPKDNRIPFKYQPCKEGDLLKFDALNTELKVIETPGHTLSHICFYNDHWLFCGDTLFNIGCGRMFEGSAEQYVNSLNKIKSLNAATEVFCTHEYTLANLQFALAVEPENPALIAYQQKVTARLKQHLPSLPTRLKTQVKLNPFLRTSNKKMQKMVADLSKSHINDEIQCFAHLRKLKDSY